MRRFPLILGSILTTIVVVLACDSGSLTDSEAGILEVQEAPLLLIANKGCPPSFDPVSVKTHPVDRNGDFVICAMALPNGRRVEVDNNLPQVGTCPPDFEVKDAQEAIEADLNKNEQICKKVAGDGSVTFTDDAVQDGDTD